MLGRWENKPLSKMRLIVLLIPFSENINSSSRVQKSLVDYHTIQIITLTAKQKLEYQIPIPNTKLEYQMPVRTIY